MLTGKELGDALKSAMAEKGVNYGAKDVTIKQTSALPID